MKNITKTITPSNDVCIQFTEDELLELNISPDDKFAITKNEDGSILLEKMESLDINLDEFDVETLKKLVAESIESDRPVGDIMRDALNAYVENNQDEDYEYVRPL
jgi:hypothetical protein